MGTNTPKIEALIDQIESGKMKSNNAKVLSYIINKGGSDLETMRYELKIPHQTLTSCISHLEDSGIIYVSHFVQGLKRKYSFYEFERLPIMREVRKNEKRDLKLNAIKKRMLRDFSDLLDNDLKELLIKTTT